MLKNNDKYAEYEFMPSALEIVERPPSPLGSFIIWTVFLLLLSTIVWAIIGKVDIVAVARGKIVPGGHLKLIQPLEEGVVKNIYVEEGQRVKKGDLLIELDSTLKGADLDGLKKSLSLARLEREIYSLELENKNIEFERILDKYSYLDDEDIYSQHRFFLARNIEYLGKKEELRLDISQNESELKMAKVNYLKLENRVKTLSVEEDNLKYLSGIGGMSKREWINKESEVYIATQEVEAQNL